jgi:hypothetical protein
MVWQYCSPIPVGRRGVISSLKLFLPVFATRKEVGTLWIGLKTDDCKEKVELFQYIPPTVLSLFAQLFMA